MCVRAGLRVVRSRLAGRVSGAAGRLRTGVCTLWCPRAQHFRTPLCVCVCVICTYGGGSLCSVGLDASFGSGLLRPLCDVIPPPSAESEPLYCAG